MNDRKGFITSPNGNLSSQVSAGAKVLASKMASQNIDLRILRKPTKFSLKPISESRGATEDLGRHGAYIQTYRASSFVTDRDKKISHFSYIRCFVSTMLRSSFELALNHWSECFGLGSRNMPQTLGFWMEHCQ